MKWSTIDQWLFHEEDAWGWNLFTRLCGVLVVALGVSALVSFDILFSEHGLTSWESGRKMTFVLRWLPDSFFNETLVRIAGVLQIAGGLLLVLGRWRPLGAFLAWSTLVLMLLRQPIYPNGGEHFLRAMCFIMIFSPSGKTSSAFFRRYVQFHTAGVYASTWFVKIIGPAWQDGTATYYVLRRIGYAAHRLPEFLDVLPVYRFLTYSTLLIELALATLIWIRPFRIPVVLSGIGLHLGIEYYMNVGIFEWMMMISLLVFLEPEDWDKIKRFARRRWQSLGLRRYKRSPERSAADGAATRT